MSGKRGASKQTVLAWADLFDGAYADNACECVRDAVLAVAAGTSSAMAETLSRYLVEPLGVYIASKWKPGSRQTHVHAALELTEFAQGLVERFNAASPPFEPDDADVVTRELRRLWDRFRAEGASHYVYSLATSRVAIARRPRKAWTNEAGETLSAELLAGRYRVNGRHDKIEALVTEFGAAKSTISDMRKAADQLLKVR